MERQPVYSSAEPMLPVNPIKPLKEKRSIIKRALPFLRNEKEKTADRRAKTAKGFFKYYHQIKPDLQFLRDEYGFKLKMGRLTHRDNIWISSANKIDIYDAVSIIPIIRKEMSKYPREFSEACQAHTFRILSDIKERKGLLDRSTQSVGGLAPSGDKFLYFGYDRDPS